MSECDFLHQEYAVYQGTDSYFEWLEKYVIKLLSASKPVESPDSAGATTNTASAEILDRANVCEYCVHLGKLIDDEANECSSCSGGYSRFLGRELRT